MNKLIIILVTLLLIWSCSSRRDVPETFAYSILIDKTDTTITSASFGEITEILNPDRNLWNALSVRIRTVEDRDFTPVVVSELPAGNPEEITEDDRKQDFRRFLKPLEKSLAQKRHKNKLTESIIYRPVLNELKMLVRSKAKTKTLFIYSDLLENNPDFSIYTPELPMKNRVILELLKQDSVPNLKGIHVYIIHSPQPGINNRRFRQMVKAYTDILEGRGASVIVSGGGEKQ